MSKKALPTLLAAGLLTCALRALPANLYRAGGLDAEHSAIYPDDYGSSGEVLLHRIQSSSASDNIFLPMSSLAGTFIFNHVSPQAWRFFRIASGVSAFFLILALACLMGGPVQGLIAVALLLLLSNVLHDGGKSIAWHGHYGYPHSVLSLLVLIVAGFCAWYGKRPSPFRGVLLGAAVGVTLLYRSTLIFFPVLFFIWAWTFWRREPRRQGWKSALLLCLVPYMFMVPWMAVNGAVHGRLSPLENGEADRIIFAGAVGFDGERTQKAEDEQYLLVKGDSKNSTEKILAWAVGEVIRHPLRFLAGYSIRLRGVFLLYPVLILAALLGLWRHRGSGPIQAVGILAAYYLLVHCFMAIEPRYFDPLWPLLAVLAAFSLTSPDKLFGPDTAFQRRSLAFMGGGLVLALSFCLFTFSVIFGYARACAHESPERLDSAVARYPGCAWLLTERGKRRLDGGDVRGAIEDLSKAEALRPDKPKEPRLAWARAIMGDPEALLESALAPDTAFYNKDINSDLLILKAHIGLRMGNTRQARKHLEAAFNIPDSSGYLLMARANALLKGRPASEKMAFHVELMGRRPESAVLRLEHAALALELLDRKAALESLHRAEALSLDGEQIPDISQYWIKQAQLALRLGDRRLAETSLLRAEGVAGGLELWHKIALAYQDMREYGKALKIFDNLVRENSSDAKLLSDRGLCKYLGGSEADAIEELKAALRLDPEFMPAYATLGAIYTTSRRPDDALRLYDAALQTPPGKDAHVRQLIIQSRRKILADKSL